MSYPYSWTPKRVKPTTASQVKVFDDHGKPAVLDVPVSVTNGTVTFSLRAKGNYVARVRGPFESEVNEFLVIDLESSTPSQYATNVLPPSATANLQRNTETTAPRWSA